MKKVIRFLAISLLVSSFSQTLLADDKNATTTTTPATTTATTPATGAADTTTANAAKIKAISVSNLLQQLQKAGYIVKSLDFNKDDGQFKVDAVDKHGDKQSLEIAATGLTADQKKVTRDAPIVVIIKKLEKGGAYIKSLTMDSGMYKASVIDMKGNEQDYTIDMTTGKVSQ